MNWIPCSSVLSVLLFFFIAIFSLGTGVCLNCVFYPYEVALQSYLLISYSILPLSPPSANLIWFRSMIQSIWHFYIDNFDHPNRSRVGVVAITLASHARGREFEPRIRYFSLFSISHTIISTLLFSSFLWLLYLIWITMVENNSFLTDWGLFPSGQMFALWATLVWSKTRVCTFFIDYCLDGLTNIIYRVYKNKCPDDYPILFRIYGAGIPIMELITCRK